MIFGIDVSDYQGAVNMAQVAAEGFQFVAIKATQGATWKGAYFARNLTAAQAANLLTWAYHYQSTDPAPAQVANITSMVPTSVPVVLDVEQGSGGLAITQEVNTRLRAAGYTVPLLYLPRWYWQQIGSPSLAGLPRLWKSEYPNTLRAAASVIYQHVPASYWDGYGGANVAVLQFTDSAIVAGAGVDASAYGGTRDQLAALLGGGSAPTKHTSEEGVSHILLDPTPAPADPKSDPATWPTREASIPIAQIGGWHGDAMVQVVFNPYYDHDPQVCAFIRWANWFTTPDRATIPPTPVGVDNVINQQGEQFRIMWPAKWGPAPKDTVSVSIVYAAPTGGCAEIERQY